MAPRSVRSALGSTRVTLPLALAAVFLGLAPAAAVGLTTSLTTPLRPGLNETALGVVPRKAAAFRITLRVPTYGRVRLFLTGKTAPRSSAPLIDTRTYACTRVGTDRLCSASYEPLPAGRYFWTIRATMPRAGRSRLTVRW